MVKHLRFKTQGLENQDGGQKFEFSLTEILQIKGQGISGSLPGPDP